MRLAPVVCVRLCAEVPAFDGEHGDGSEQQGDGTQDDDASDVDAVCEGVVPSQE